MSLAGYHIEGAEAHFEPEEIKQETSTNLDISLRRFSGDFGYTVNFFSITILKLLLSTKHRISV